MSAPETITPEEYRRRLAKRRRGGWGVATPTARAGTAARTACEAGGHRHGSRLEARVCGALAAYVARADAVLFVQVRVPLVAAAPGPDGRPLYLTVDFAVVRPPRDWKWYDAKPRGGRRSRDWLRGARIFEATWGPIVEIHDAAEVMAWGR